MGNVGSIRNMYKKIGVETIITNDNEVISKADKIIIPGDGAFDTGMHNLRKFDLLNNLNSQVLVHNKPVLGICVGMQLMTKKSGEGKEVGLSWLDAEVIRFNFEEKTLKTPHMGWNDLKVRKNEGVTKDLPEDSRFYFVHSYYIKCYNEDDIAAETNYGHYFTSIFQKDNIFGVQFHPEKSHRFGMKILENFAKL
jgi:imidazole glycerol-phosphate synthase subunit HisH